MSVSHQEYPDVVGLAPDVPESAVFEPYIPAERNLRELTALPVVMGTILGAIFGASSLYLVLKVGLTVSASIPVAVISITLFRILSKLGMRDATILENNIVQTAGSAGESIAFGVGVTMPALMLLRFDLGISRLSFSASATSSDRESLRSCAPAACSHTWYSFPRSSSSAPVSRLRWPQKQLA